MDDMDKAMDGKIQINDCPFCGSKHGAFVYRSAQSSYFVTCTQCHADGPPAHNCDEAASLWNRAPRQWPLLERDADAAIDAVSRFSYAVRNRAPIGQRIEGSSSERDYYDTRDRLIAGLVAVSKSKSKPEPEPSAVLIRTLNAVREECAQVCDGLETRARRRGWREKANAHRQAAKHIRESVWVKAPHEPAHVYNVGLRGEMIPADKEHEPEPPTGKTYREPAPHVEAIQRQCAHFGGAIGEERCMLLDRNWSPGVAPARCVLCPDNDTTPADREPEPRRQAADREPEPRRQAAVVDVPSLVGRLVKGLLVSGFDNDDGAEKVLQGQAGLVSGTICKELARCGVVHYPVNLSARRTKSYPPTYSALDLEAAYAGGQASMRGRAAETVQPAFDKARSRSSLHEAVEGDILRLPILRCDAAAPKPATDPSAADVYSIKIEASTLAELYGAGLGLTELDNIMLKENTAETRDAARYRKLRSIGAAPSGTKYLDEGTVLVATNLDAYLDADFSNNTYRSVRPSPDNSRDPFGTDDLVRRFAVAMKDKLRRNSNKRVLSGSRGDDWLTITADDNAKCLAEHVQKGDPLDVAAFAAFAWHHGYSTAVPSLAIEMALRLVLQTMFTGWRLSDTAGVSLFTAMVEVCRGDENAARFLHILTPPGGRREGYLVRCARDLYRIDADQA